MCKCPAAIHYTPHRNSNGGYSVLLRVGKQHTQVKALNNFWLEIMGFFFFLPNNKNTYGFTGAALLYRERKERKNEFEISARDNADRMLLVGSAAEPLRHNERMRALTSGWDNIIGRGRLCALCTAHREKKRVDHQPKTTQKIISIRYIGWRWFLLLWYRIL